LHNYKNMETKITVLFPEYATISAGKEFMSSSESPIGFMSKTKFYTATGVVTDVTGLNTEIMDSALVLKFYFPGDETTESGILYTNNGFLKYNKEI